MAKSKPKKHAATPNTEWICYKRMLNRASSFLALSTKHPL